MQVWKLMVLVVLAWIAVVGLILWAILATDWIFFFSAVGELFGELVRAFKEASNG